MLATVFVLSGCGLTLPGVRLAPGEEQRQTAQVARDLAAIADASGLPPQSPASQRLAAAAATASTYAGQPDQAVDVGALVPEGVRDAWWIRTQQAERRKIREGLYARTTTSISHALAEIAGDIESEAEVAVIRILPRLRAIADAAQLVQEAATEIDVPADPGVSVADQERLEALDAAVTRLTQAAEAQAARRPTAKEVAGQVAEQAEETMSWLEDVGLDELLYAGLGVAGLGGVGVAVRNHRKRKTAEKAVEAAGSEAAMRDLIRDVIAAVKEQPPPAG